MSAKMSIAIVDFSIFVSYTKASHDICLRVGIFLSESSLEVRAYMKGLNQIITIFKILVQMLKEAPPCSKH